MQWANSRAQNMLENKQTRVRGEVEFVLLRRPSTLIRGLARTRSGAVGSDQGGGALRGEWAYRILCAARDRSREIRCRVVRDVGRDEFWPGWKRQRWRCCAHRL